MVAELVGLLEKKASRRKRPEQAEEDLLKLHQHLVDILLKNGVEVTEVIPKEGVPIRKTPLTEAIAFGCYLPILEGLEKGRLPEETLLQMPTLLEHLTEEEKKILRETVRELSSKDDILFWWNAIAEELGIVKEGEAIADICHLRVATGCATDQNQAVLFLPAVIRLQEVLNDPEGYRVINGFFCLNCEDGRRLTAGIYPLFDPQERYTSLIIIKKNI